jgi:hypothetical protein
MEDRAKWMEGKMRSTEPDFIITRETPNQQLKNQVTYNYRALTHGTSTKEEFEVIRFVENNAPFPLLLRKTWIEKDHIRRKVEEEDTKKKKK